VRLVCVELVFIPKKGGESIMVPTTPQRVRIVCINKSGGDHLDANEAVSNYGWIYPGTVQYSKAIRQDMVDWLSRNGNSAYVETNGKQSECYVRTSVNGTKFLQTYSDGYWNNNLLSLPECI
jgi:hypothetical protein